MADRKPDRNETLERIGDLELASKRRIEADLRLTMNERLERMSQLSRQLGQIKGIAKR